MTRDDLIFDIGMHRGEDTAYYLVKGFDIVGFEADPDHVAHCRARFAEQVAAGRLHIVEGAIAPPTASGRVVFYKNLGNSFQGTISAGRAVQLGRRRKESVVVEVPIVNLVEQFRTFGIPYFLKIDIETVERLALAPLFEFSDRPRYISLESEREDFSKLQEELGLLRQLGYSRFAAIQQKYIGQTTIETSDRFGNPLKYTFESGSSGRFGEDISEWMSHDECVDAYRAIFRRIRRYGEHSWLATRPGGRQVKSILRRTGLINPMPGWYDTHAALG